MKRLAILIGAVIILGAALFFSSREGPKRPKRIVLIVIDTLRADFLSTYGFPGANSPNIGLLAQEGVLFEKAVATAPWTMPSVAGIFTSLDPIDHQMVNYKSHPKEWTADWIDFPAMNSNVVTLAQTLYEAGYTGYSTAQNLWLHPMTGLRRGFYQIADYPNVPGDYESLNQMRDWYNSNPEDLKFLHAHLMFVHANYKCTKEDEAEMRKIVPGERRQLTENERSMHGRKNFKAPNWVEAGEENLLEFWPACYAGGIKEFDRFFGAFLSELRKNPLWQDTLLIFTADHGEQFLEHGAWEHGSSFHYHTTNVPLIIMFPNGEYKGTRVAEPVSLAEIMPTILDYMNVSYEPNINAHTQSLMPAIEGRKLPERILFSSASRDDPSAVAVIDGHYKLILNGDEAELFDYLKDPKEKLPVHSGKLTYMLKEAKSYRLRKSHYEIASVPAAPEAIEQLKSLGYIK